MRFANISMIDIGFSSGMMRMKFEIPHGFYPCLSIPGLSCFCCLPALLTLAIAVLNTLVPLWLAHEHLPTWQVGMVSSSYFTGNLVGTLLTGYLIKRLGFNRSYYLASLVFAAGCLGLGLMIGFWSWMAWRFVAGVGCAMIWVVVESALMCSGTSRNRGVCSLHI